jgi:hypothetical protein
LFVQPQEVEGLDPGEDRHLLKRVYIAVEEEEEVVVIFEY